MKVDLTFSELEDLIKLHEAEKKKAIKQREYFKDEFCENQMQPKLMDYYEQRLIDTSNRINVICSRLRYLNKTRNELVENAKKLLNNLYGVDGIDANLSIKDMLELIDKFDLDGEE